MWLTTTPMLRFCIDCFLCTCLLYLLKKFNQTPPQVKVREATSNDPWGPSSTQMSEIADLTYNMVSWFGHFVLFHLHQIYIRWRSRK